MKFATKFASIISLLLLTHNAFSSETPKAPQPGDHILNPSNHRELLKNIAKLEKDNLDRVGSKRPDMAKLSLTMYYYLIQMSDEQKKHIVSNIYYLQKLDKMKDWQPRKPTKRSWSPMLLNLPIIGYYCFMDQAQRDICDYNQRKEKLDSYQTSNLNGSSYDLGGLLNQQHEFRKTKTYEMAVKQLPFDEQIGVTKNNRFRAAYADQMELAVRHEKIPDKDIESFLRDTWQKRRYGYVEIIPLSNSDKVNANECIQYYLEQRKAIQTPKERLNHFSGQFKTSKDMKYRYAYLMEHAIQCEEIAADKIENFLNNNFIHRNISTEEMGPLRDNTWINYYLNIRKMYEKSEDRIEHFKQSYNRHWQVVNEIDALHDHTNTKNHDKFVVPKYVAIYRGINEKADL